MDSATPFEKATLVPPVLAAIALIALVEPNGYIEDPLLAFCAMCVGVVSSLLALALALRAGRPQWLRWAAVGEAGAFTVAATLLLRFLSTVPFS